MKKIKQIVSKVLHCLFGGFMLKQTNVYLCVQERRKLFTNLSPFICGEFRLRGGRQ